MESFKVIAFTHKTLAIDLVGKLHLSVEEQNDILTALKYNFDFQELLYLSTCNRTELFIVCEKEISQQLVREITVFLNNKITWAEAEMFSVCSQVFKGEKAIEHVFRVAASLESLVVGEREIITQVRKAYEFCRSLNLTGDFLRLLLRQTIETAKAIYTQTSIAKNPVSVASLAFRQLKKYGIKNDARVIFIGSGETNSTLAAYFKKHQLNNFTVFNRSIENAQKLAGLLKGAAFELTELSNYKAGFDVLVVCTASSEVIVTEAIYETLNQGEVGKKTIIDLGVPANVASGVAQNTKVNYIDVGSLKKMAEANMELRKKEMVKCEEIIHKKAIDFEALHFERRIELALGEVPKKVKEIKELAFNEVFAIEINAMEATNRAVLEKVVAYMEKKYNAVAIKTAKEALLEGFNN